MADSAQAEGCSLGTQRRVGIGAEQGLGRGREPRAPGLLTCAVDQESQEDEDPGHRAAEQRSASSVRRAPGSSRGRASPPPRPPPHLPEVGPWHAWLPVAIPNFPGFVMLVGGSGHVLALVAPALTQGKR